MDHQQWASGDLQMVINYSYHSGGTSPTTRSTQTCRFLGFTDQLWLLLKSTFVPDSSHYGYHHYVSNFVPLPRLETNDRKYRHDWLYFFCVNLGFDWTKELPKFGVVLDREPEAMSPATSFELRLELAQWIDFEFRHPFSRCMGLDPACLDHPNVARLQDKMFFLSHLPAPSILERQLSTRLYEFSLTCARVAVSPLEIYCVRTGRHEVGFGPRLGWIRQYCYFLMTRVDFAWFHNPETMYRYRLDDVCRFLRLLVEAVEDLKTEFICPQPANLPNLRQMRSHRLRMSIQDLLAATADVIVAALKIDSPFQDNHKLHYVYMHETPTHEIDGGAIFTG